MNSSMLLTSCVQSTEHSVNSTNSSSEGSGVHSSGNENRQPNSCSKVPSFRTCYLFSASCELFANVSTEQRSLECVSTFLLLSGRTTQLHVQIVIVKRNGSSFQIGRFC